ncbi:MAG: inositol monophosphatase [Thermoanaerobaculaceae bacterium]|jgi:myo-inositol-1(or 4)-monophosphatase|nr:inositol monophosphatase [Thermoanaerobaculaceae bacterium]
MTIPPGAARELLALAISAAELGGGVLQRFFRRLRAGEVSEKSRNDFVSAADQASEAAIVSFLRARAPDLGMLAEEQGASGDATVRWVLDPLDGTLNFVRGFPHFAVSLALVAEGRIELGVVHDPMRGETFTAVLGGGAFCNGTPLEASRRAGLAGGFVTTGFPYRVMPYLDEYLAVFRDAFLLAGALRRPGAAALDLAHTAAGIFDAFFEFGLSAWDIAAGTLLVREAGGVVTNLAGGEDVFAHGNIVAGGPQVQPELLALIAPHLAGGRVPAP